MEEMEEGEVAVEGEIYDVGFSERQKMEVDTSVKEIQHRNAEIKNIQKSILELAEIFKEMAVLVVDQVPLPQLFNPSPPKKPPLTPHRKGHDS